jgi:hypothetical protein
MVSFSSLLYSNLLVFVVWLIIMGKLSHYWSSPVFPFDDIDKPRLWQDCFDRGVLEYLIKYVSRHRTVIGRNFCKIISFSVFVTFDVFHHESLEIALHHLN